MKIIFDSEEQKEVFLANIIICPSDLGMEKFQCADCMEEDACERCWQQAGVEIEVAT